MNAISVCKHELLKTQRAMNKLVSPFGYVENGKEMARLASYAKVCKEGLEYLERLKTGESHD